MDIYDLSKSEIENLSPEEFRALIIGDENEEEDDNYSGSKIEEVIGEMSDYLGKAVILLGNSEIDGDLIYRLYVTRITLEK